MNNDTGASPYELAKGQHMGTSNWKIVKQKESVYWEAL